MRRIRWASIGLTVAAIALLILLPQCTSVHRDQVYVSPDGVVHHVVNGEEMEVTIRGLQATTQPSTAQSAGWTGRGDFRADPAHLPAYVTVTIVSESPGAFTRQSSSISAEHVDIQLLPEAAPAQAKSNKDASSIRLSILRPAGRLVLTGVGDAKSASGNVTFDPDPNYFPELQRLTGTPITPERTLALMLDDLPLDYVQAIRDAGYQPSLDDVLSLRHHGVTPGYAKGFREAGYEFSCAQLIQLNNYGIRPDYARELREAGYDLGIDQIIKLNNYGIRPGYMKGLAAAGYKFDVDQVIHLNNYGIRPEYVQAFADAGYRLQVDQLVKLSNYGIRPELAKATTQASRKQLTTDELINLSQYGIRAEYITGFSQAGYNFSTSELIKLSQYGIRPDYAKGMRDAGYSFSADDLIQLSQYGVRPDFAAALHVTDRPNLGARDIIDLSQKGIDAQTLRKLRGS